MTNKDTEVDNLIINQLTKAEFDSIDKSETELYFVIDDKIQASEIEGLNVLLSEKQDTITDLETIRTNAGYSIVAGSMNYGGYDPATIGDVSIRNVTQFKNDNKVLQIGFDKSHFNLNNSVGCVQLNNDIVTNSSNGATAYTTIQGYGDIVSHNAIEFALKSEIPSISGLAKDSDVVHKANAENISGVKTFTGGTGGNNVAIKAPNGIAIGGLAQTAYSQYATIRLVNDKVNTGSYYIDGNGSVLFRHKTGTKTAEGSANDVMFTMNPETGIKAGWGGTAGKGITDADLHDVLIDTIEYSKLTTTAKDVLGAINEVKSSIPSLVGYATETFVQNYHDSTKQDTLISGTNIKTINGESIVGSGDIEIKGGIDITYDEKNKRMIFRGV